MINHDYGKRVFCGCSYHERYALKLIYDLKSKFEMLKNIIKSFLTLMANLQYLIN